MKTDNYLSLCLEQATKSPLHYRHGSIVVRGGKVIGQGYNDYRPGFNGGALKHGRIAKAGAFDRDAVAELKKKLKGKQKLRQPNQQQQQQQNCSTFTPFEVGTSNGGGHSVNQPLSMHSEMMAIYSALNASSTLSSSTFSREKPCFKLPRSDKRKARLRREVLYAYVAAVSQAAAGTGQWQASNHNNTPEHDNDNKAPRYYKDPGLVFHGKNERQNHHHESLNEKKKNGKKRNENQYHYEQYEQYEQYEHESKKRPARKTPSNDLTREHDSTTFDDRHDNEITKVMTENFHTGTSKEHAAHRGDKRKKDYKPSAKVRTENPTLDSEASQDQPLLLPASRTARHDVTQRQQHSRLRGADIYVTRLGWSGKPMYKSPKAKNAVRRSYAQQTFHAEASTSSDSDALVESISSLSALSLSSSHSGTGSLHDELVNREPSPSLGPASPTRAHDCFDISKIAASRPCYRCVTFMHQVGIRRVFWTNDAGEWEGGKVASLIEALDVDMESNADGGPIGNGVFVTKHEVLMLRRMMGSNSNGN